MRWETNRYVLPAPRVYNVKFIAKYILSMVLRLFYRIIFMFVRPQRKSDYTYEMNLCAIFKNEAPYLKEWIEFHRIVGVDHFYLYNNNSDDDYYDVLKLYIEEGVVTLEDWPENHAQMKAYRNWTQKRKCESHWIAFIDIDEFIVPRHVDDLKEWLKKFGRRPTVKLNWKVFGTSGMIDRDLTTLVTEKFTICWDKIDMVGKCLMNNDFDFNPEFGKNTNFHHSAWGGWKGIQLPPVNCLDHICINDFEWMGTDDVPVVINHYFTKSLSEYVKKSGKGDVYFKENPHTLDYMWAHERRCMKSDYSVYKYLTKPKQAMAD